MIAERVKEVIQESGLSLPAFAKRMRVSKNTLINYRDGSSYPNSEFLTKVCEEFLINPEWLLLGTGPMKAEQSLSDMGMHLETIYPPGRKASSPTPSEEGEVVLESADLDLNPQPSVAAQGFKISEDLQKAARVLESGTAYAIALHLNIQQFDRALDDHTGIQQLKRTVDRQGTTISAQAETIQALQSTMAQESAAMRKEVEELKSQLARLLATGEDNPDHGQEVA